MYKSGEPQAALKRLLSLVLGMCLVKEAGGLWMRPGTGIGYVEGKDYTVGQVPKRVAIGGSRGCWPRRAYE